MSKSWEQDRDEIRAMVRESLQRQIGGASASQSPGSQSLGSQPLSGQSPVETTSNADSQPLAPAAVMDESVKDVITEADVRDISEGAKLIIREGAIITPAARDLIRERSVEIRHRALRSATGKHRLIAVGSDHGGYEMKERLKEFLGELGYRHRDFGTFSEDAVDYPDFAHAVARAVADGACDLGVIIDGAGIGSCMTANKVPGVRAAMCYDEATAHNSREHNYANVLTLGGRMITTEKMREIVNVWLSTPEGAARHGKRVAKLLAIEKQYLR